MTHPEPLVPAEVDLRDFPFTPMFRARLFGSQFHANANDAEWRAGVTLWLKSWDQVPAGSLPTDDVALCRLAELGRDLKTWKRIKGLALHGWIECSDGRLHHKVVAEGVNDAWARKLAQRDRTEKARAARLANRQSQPDANDHNGTVTHSVTDAKAVSGEQHFASKRQGQGQGQLDQIPNPSPAENKNLINGFHAGNGTGNGTSSVTIEDPLQRIARFQTKLAEKLGPGGHLIVLNAMDSKHPQHAQSLSLCKEAARQLGKGWPRNWPVDP